VKGHSPAGIVALIGSELAPGDNVPDDGSNATPPAELVAAQLKSPVELESFVSVTVQVDGCPVADWQFEVDFTFNTFAPILPGRLHDDRRPMTIIARQAIDICFMRVISLFFLANKLNLGERLALVLRTLRESIRRGPINRRWAR
jgi:hypothetical protein